MDILIEDYDENLWVAAVEKGRLYGLEIDPAHELVRYAAIYWGEVLSIDKAMDAAYIALDGAHIGLLNNADVCVRQDNGKIVRGGEKAIGTLLTPGQMVAVQAKSGVIATTYMDDLRAEQKTVPVSMDIALAGRYLIYTPYEEENRISSRIKDKKLRKQLQLMMGTMEAVKGCILRAAAAHLQTDILIREYEIMLGVWEQVQSHCAGNDPILVMDGPDAMQRMIGDMAGKSIDRIEIVTLDRFRDIEEWCEVLAPDLVTRIHPIELENAQDDLALFETRDLITPIEDLFQPYVMLESGINLIIQETAALTAIDVNRGRHQGSALSVNSEAVQEIARQIRLRNLGGIIVIDALKMKNKEDQKRFLTVLKDVFADDPCTVQVHGLTALGLVELTRKRRTPSLDARIGALPD